MRNGRPNTGDVHIVDETNTWSDPRAFTPGRALGREYLLMTAMATFKRVTVFGGITVDRIARTAAAPIPGASNPGTVRTTSGGVGFNVATTLSRLGLDVRLVAIVGADPEGEVALAAADAAGVDVSHVVRSRHEPTATYQAAFDDRGELVIGVADMAIYDVLDPASVASAISSPAAAGEFWVVDANLPAETLDFLVGEAEAARRPIAGLAVSPVKAVRLATLFDRLSYLFANRREAVAILGRDPDEKSPSDAELAAELGRSGAGVVVSNAGKPLSMASNGDARGFLPLRAAVASVNGAGDALTAGTIYGMSQGRSLFEAVRFGLASAALAVESFDAVRSDLTASLLAERIVAGAGAS